MYMYMHLPPPPKKTKTIILSFKWQNHCQKSFHIIFISVIKGVELVKQEKVITLYTCTVYSPCDVCSL